MRLHRQRGGAAQILDGEPRIGEGAAPIEPACLAVRAARAQALKRGAEARRQRRAVDAAKGGLAGEAAHALRPARAYASDA